MALRLHIANRTLRFRDRAIAPRRIRFHDTDFLTVEQLGPMQSLSPEGFLIIRNVPLARIGPQLYSDQEIPIKGDAAGKIIIDREPDEVFRPATLASLQGKAVTLDHPEDDVMPENYKELLVGTVINPRRGERVMDNLLLGDLIIYDPEAIKAIRNKDVREVSVGYKADYEETGNARGRQRNIICNHLALVRDGRCGPICRIGDTAFFPRHEADCGCAQCSTHDFDESQHKRDEGGKFSSTGGGSMKPHAPEENSVEPTTGSPIRVLRLGSETGGLKGRNAGNLRSVATHLVNTSSDEGPVSAGGVGNTVSVYHVKLPEKLDNYAMINAGSEPGKNVGRTTKTHGDKTVMISYSFPHDFSGEERVAAIPLSEIKKELKDMGYSSADYAGTLNTEKAMRTVMARHGLKIDGPTNDAAEDLLHEDTRDQSPVKALKRTGRRVHLHF
jgi:hypothetical protein